MQSKADNDLLELRKRIRHSAAHVMADVVTRMFPESKLAIGPPTEDGFYYDFLVEEPFKDEDLEAIENEMREVIALDQNFEYKEYSRDEFLSISQCLCIGSTIVRQLYLNEPNIR